MSRAGHAHGQPFDGDAGTLPTIRPRRAAARGRDILELFAEAQRLATVRVDWEELRSIDEGGVEGWRQAYKASHREAGLCVSCREPAVPGRQTCVRHGRSTEKSRARMKAYETANRERRTAQKRAAYWRRKGQAA